MNSTTTNTARLAVDPNWTAEPIKDRAVDLLAGLITRDMTDAGADKVLSAISYLNSGKPRTFGRKTA